MARAIFIDTNILTGYLLLSGIKRSRNEEDKKRLWKQYKKIIPSYDFIINILNSKNKKFKFVTSPLAISEIFHTLYEEAVCKKMWDDGVPLSSWIRQKPKFIKFIGDFEIKELEKDIRKLYREKNLKIIDEVYDLDLISRLILKYGLMTQDAILFSTAMSKSCKFFISRDEDFTKNVKLKEDFNQIVILNPEEIEGIIQPLIKKIKSPHVK